MIAMRCSSLPLFMKCAQSMRGETSVSEWYPETVLGTAAHVGAAGVVRGEPVDVAAIAAMHGVDPTDLRFLVSQANEAWKELIPPPAADTKVTTEEKMKATVLPDADLTGGADVLVNAIESVDIIDWKSGRKDGDYREQVIGYCVLALVNHPSADRATARVVWLRTLEAELYTLRRVELPMWLERFGQQLKDQTYRPGPHCSHCPRQFTCAGRLDMQRASLAILGAEGGRTLRQMAPGEQITLYRRAKDIANLARRVVDEVRAIVDEDGGLEADGTRLELVEEHRRSVRTLPAWPILQRLLDDDALAGVVTVSLPQAQAAVAASVPRGQGAAASRALLAELETAGAVETTTIKKLSEKRSR
jgi:hypothetical protein